MSEDDKQIGHNEHDARAGNEIVSVEGEQSRLGGHEALAVLCECGDSQCHEPLTMTVDDYEHIRSKPAQFAVLTGHEIPAVEQVVGTREGYLIVEKFGDAGRVADAGDPRHHLKTCRVVVVDDIPEIRYLLKMILATEPSCMVVGEAGNGAEAIDIIDGTQPEVVVLDLEMPVMDGWHALPHIRRVSPTTHVIVFSSTPVDARLEKRLTNLGADAFVPKGGDPSVIVRAIREIALGGRERRFSRGEGSGRHDHDEGDGVGSRDTAGILFSRRAGSTHPQN